MISRLAEVLPICSLCSSLLGSHLVLSDLGWEGLCFLLFRRPSLLVWWGLFNAALLALTLHVVVRRSRPEVA